MNKYEVMYIVNPNLDEEATKGVVERFQNVITDNGGEVENLKEMGKRRLAYEINDLREGYYVLVNFNAEPSVVSELDRLMRLNENVFRHLVIKEDE